MFESGQRVRLKRKPKPGEYMTGGWVNTFDKQVGTLGTVLYTFQNNKAMRVKMDNFSEAYTFGIDFFEPAELPDEDPIDV